MVESSSYSGQRSNARKQLRKNLLEAISQGHNNHLYACERCGTGPTSIPYSTYWNSEWNIELPSLDKQLEGVYLDADHKDKDWTNNDAGNGELLCRTCHREKDRVSSSGVDPNVDDLFGYASTFVLRELVDRDDPNFQDRTAVQALTEGFDH